MDQLWAFFHSVNVLKPTWSIASRSQPLWHQGPVLCKATFPWSRVNFSMEQAWGACFGDDSSALHLLYTLFLLILHHLHLKASSIRSWRLGTHDLYHCHCGTQKNAYFEKYNFFKSRRKKSHCIKTENL